MKIKNLILIGFSLIFMSLTLAGCSNNAKKSTNESSSANSKINDYGKWIKSEQKDKYGNFNGKFKYFLMLDLSNGGSSLYVSNDDEYTNNYFVCYIFDERTKAFKQDLYGEVRLSDGNNIKIHGRELNTTGTKGGIVIYDEYPEKGNLSTSKIIDVLKAEKKFKLYFKEEKSPYREFLYEIDPIGFNNILRRK